MLWEVLSTGLPAPTAFRYCRYIRFYRIWTEILTHSLSHSYQMLLDKRVPIDLRDRNGLTSLHMAVSAGKEEAVAFLLANHANVNLYLQGTWREREREREREERRGRDYFDVI